MRQPSALERLFDLTARRSSVGRELRGAVATFLTMAYLLFVNPSILAAAGEPLVLATLARAAIGAGIGLFIAFIGLVHAKIVVLGIPDAPVAPGSLRDRQTLIALIGLLVTACLMARKITGALIIGIVLTTALSFAAGLQHL